MFEFISAHFFGIASTLVLLFLILFGLPWLTGARYIGNNRVGIVEKLWAKRGSLRDGSIIALQGEAGFQAELLRGGLHFGYFPWQYRVHQVPLVTIEESRLGYVYARDGSPLEPHQALGRVIDCQNYQDAGAFLSHNGQRGRQRHLLREGVYAINTALFVVITEQAVYAGPLRDAREQYLGWQAQLSAAGGFRPVVIGHGTDKDSDSMGVVTVADGPPLASGELIAPEVKAADGNKSHENFQDPEAFLALGGRRGKQLQVLTDGTFFINRWFATVELHPKTLIPIGYVGVVVSYHGTSGEDLTGEMFRYGEQVEPGQRGVWKRALPPGKYALNPYAQKVEFVPTINFVLRWITGTTEAHQYDKDLQSIELITADGYEPLLPLSLVLHIDYEKAPRVVQRFGDVKRLISQTLDPILSAYFRDVAQSSNMLDLLTSREAIQLRATEELQRRFTEYDINCIAVLIGRPESQHAAGKGEDPIERLFDQLRVRRLAEEQIQTFNKQQEAATKLRELSEAQAIAQKQTELTQTSVDIQIAANKGESALAEARRLAQRDVVRAEADSRSRELQGKGEAAKVAEIGRAEAEVVRLKVEAFGGDPRIQAIQGVVERLAQIQQPLVPQRVVMMGGAGADGNQNAGGVLGQLLTALLAEKVLEDPTAVPPQAPKA